MGYFFRASWNSSLLVACQFSGFYLGDEWEPTFGCCAPSFLDWGGDWRVWSQRVSAKFVCGKVWPGPESRTYSSKWWYLRRATAKWTLKWWDLLFPCRSFNGDVVYLLWDLFSWHHHAVITKYHNALLRTCSTPSTDVRETAMARFRYFAADASSFRSNMVCGNMRNKKSLEPCHRKMVG